MTKQCSKCRIEQDVTNFNSDRQRTDGLHPYCRSCVKHRWLSKECQNALNRRKARTWTISEDTRKTCTKCGDEKHPREFQKAAQLEYGVSAQCKMCHRARSKLGTAQGNLAAMEGGTRPIGGIMKGRLRKVGIVI